MRQLLVIIALVVCNARVRAEEAVAPSGRVHQGRLIFDKAGWRFADAKGGKLPFEKLALIRFGAGPVPLAKAPLRHVLHLPNGQRAAGVLQRVDGQKVAFVASWGKAYTLDRANVTGIELANDSLEILHEDFESPPKDWRLEGKPVIDSERSYFGKSSLRLKAAAAVRTWKPGIRAGAARLVFHPAGNAAIEVLLDPPRQKTPTLLIDAAMLSCANLDKALGGIKTTPAWRGFSAEASGARLRLFVEDYCLGQTALVATETVVGIRIKCVDEGAKLWIDELNVSRRITPLPRPRPVKDQDMVWLEKGEQLFGQIAAADAERVTLDAKFGKRAFAWSRVRGILFAQPMAPARVAEPEITFRPGPGFPVDRVRGKMVRWEGSKLIIAHATLGEFAIDRERLHTIRPAAK